jgi:two-component sensor histidine kinase
MIPGPAQWRRFQNFATQRLAFLGRRVNENLQLYQDLARRPSARTRDRRRNFQLNAARFEQMRLIMQAIRRDRAEMVQFIRRLLNIEPM